MMKPKSVVLMAETTATVALPQAQAMLTVPEVARVLRCSEQSVYAACARGELPCVKFGQLVRIPQAAFAKWLQAKMGRRRRRPWRPPLFESGDAA